MAKIFLRKADGDDGEHWLTISDLMSGLMIIFLFIAVAFMRHTAMEKDKITDIAVAYQENQVAIFHALNAEFEKDLPIWDASIDKETLSFQFNSPEVLFLLYAVPKAAPEFSPATGALLKVLPPLSSSLLQ